VLLACWLLAGRCSEGWAHYSRPRGESFLTPWHAAVDSAFGAVAAWMCWSVWTRRRLAGSWREAVPAGYGLGLAGLAIFLASGAGDMSWHIAFGIERDIDALLSPTHLGLFTGAFLIVTTPLRSAWADPDTGRRVSFRAVLPALLSLTLAGSLAAFMFQYLHPIVEDFVSIGREQFYRQGFTVFQYHDVHQLAIQAGVPGFMLSSAFLFGPLLFLLRRWNPPAGSALLVIGAQSLMLQLMTGLQDAGLAEVALIGAVAIEALLAALRPAPASRWRVRSFCALAPVVFWGVYLGGIALHDGGLGWNAEDWGGAMVWSALTMLAVAMLMFPPAVPARRPSTGAAA
jgi:hypothetical protein